MIIVHGVLRVFENQRSRALVLMQDMATASQLEAGCVSYEFYVGLTDPNTLLLFQEWEAVDALQGHFETDHMEEFLKLLPSFLDGEVASRRYEVRVNNGLFEAGDFDPEQVYIEEEREKIIH